MTGIDKEVKTGKIEKMFDNLIAVIENNRTDMQKFDKGQNAAGTRLRKVLQSIKTGSQDVRIMIMDEIKTRKDKVKE